MQFRSIPTIVLDSALIEPPPGGVLESYPALMQFLYPPPMILLPTYPFTLKKLGVVLMQLYVPPNIELLNIGWAASNKHL